MFIYIKKKVLTILFPPFKKFALNFIGSDFLSYIFWPGRNPHDIWCWTQFHWIDLSHCFRVYPQSDIWGKSSVVIGDCNLPSVITFFLSNYCRSRRLSRPVGGRAVYTVCSGRLQVTVNLNSYLHISKRILILRQFPLVVRSPILVFSPLYLLWFIYNVKPLLRQIFGNSIQMKHF